MVHCSKTCLMEGCHWENCKYLRWKSNLCFRQCVFYLSLWRWLDRYQCIGVVNRCTQFFLSIYIISSYHVVPQRLLKRQLKQGPQKKERLVGWTLFDDCDDDSNSENNYKVDNVDEDDDNNDDNNDNNDNANDNDNDIVNDGGDDDEDDDDKEDETIFVADGALERLLLIVGD